MKAYVLGVSHVSRESCDEAAELIAAVRPDVVVLELCKDRLRLLLDQVSLFLNAGFCNSCNPSPASGSITI